MSGFKMFFSKSHQVIIVIQVLKENISLLENGYVGC